MTRPDLAYTIPGANKTATTTTNTPPPTTVKPVQPRSIRIPAASPSPRDYRRARVTKADDAGNEIAHAAATTTHDDASTATANFFASQRFASPAPASARKRAAGESGVAAGAKSLRPDWSGNSRATTLKNVSWAPLPDREQEEGNNHGRNDESVEGEIPRDVEMFSSSSSSSP